MNITATAQQALPASDVNLTLMTAPASYAKMAALVWILLAAMNASAHLDLMAFLANATSTTARVSTVTMADVWTAWVTTLVSARQVSPARVATLRSMNVKAHLVPMALPVMME